MAAERQPAAPAQIPVVEPGTTFRTINDKISSIVLGGTPLGWWIGFAVAFMLVMLLLFSISYLLVAGIGVWGVDIPVAWGFAIVNFVWWIGIGHAGTLISAVLLILRQQWRTSINRFAEAMTLFAVANAGLFPLLHLGRPYYFFWLMPYPTHMGVWPQFRSALVWDFFAVSTYLTVSLIFWYVGLVPDLAAIRDRARNRFVKIVYGLFALGWRGSARHWYRYRSLYFLLGALATPLVASVHSVVSFDFAIAIVPGWHSTIFPPYFVAGAIYSGFAMVLTIAIPLRKAYGLQAFITERHFDNIAKVMLASGLLVAYGYLMESFIAWYSGNEFELYQVVNRALGDYGWIFWALMLLNVVIPQLLWLRRVRLNNLALFAVATSVNVGMWVERFVIVIVPLSQDYLPSSWGFYLPTIWDIATLAGTLGLFVALIFLFIRLLPMISQSEMRELVTRTEGAEARTS
jgi:molybdopterin-containing oxidoreductase family membrane subunit